MTDNSVAVVDVESHEILIEVANPIVDVEVLRPSVEVEVVGVPGPPGPPGPAGPPGGGAEEVAVQADEPTESSIELWLDLDDESGGAGAGGHAIQDEGTVLTARPALNFVGAGVTATDDAANARTIVTVPGGGAGGTTILSGTAAPAVGTGNVGDYYLDTDDNVLYGPKKDVVYQSVFTDEALTSLSAPAGYTRGSDFTFAAAGQITALKWNKPAGNVQNTHTLYAWNTSTQQKLAQVTTNNESGLSGMQTAVLAVPISVTAGQTIRVSVDIDVDQSAWRTSGVIVNGDVTLKDQGYYQNPGTYPSALSSNRYVVDVVFQKTDASIWPVAIQGSHLIKDEGVALAARANLNFVGAGVTATDDSVNNATVVTVPGAALQARTTAAWSTASLAGGASESGTIALAPGYRLLAVTFSAPCRLRLYTTAAKRDGDASRPIGTDPVGDHGLVFEFVAVDGLLSADLAPLVDGYDAKAVPDGAVPYHVTNTGSDASVITATLTWLRTE